MKKSIIIRTKALISTVGLTLGLSSGGLAQQNLIVNGSFESGQAGFQHFPGWDQIGPADNYSDYGVAQSSGPFDVAQQGNFYAYFHGHPTDSSQDCLGQTVNLTVGAQYTISYYMATDGSTLGSGASMYVVIGSSFGIDYSQDTLLTAYLPNSSNAIPYQKFTTTITATNPTEILSFHAVDATSAILLDNVSMSLAAYAPPGISAPPTNQVTSAGGSANFYVTATGSAPLSYQWTFGETPLSGATTASLGLTNVQANQAGGYAVVVSNPGGSVTSTVATLTVLVPPSIAAQPTNQTVVVGANARFQVGATGTTPLSYQWSFNGAGLSDATASALALNNVQTSQAGAYSVVVTNSAGSVTSVIATLTVLVPPSITLQPTNQTAVVGNNVAFQATATGSTPLSYQWFFGATALPGAMTLGLTNVQADQAGGYALVVTNAAGAVTSAVAQLTVLVPPALTSQPTNQTVATGASASFQASATGTSPLSYQWWFNATNGVGSNTNILSLTNVQVGQAGGYSVVVTNAAGAVTSAVATLTVGTPPAITQQPSGLVVVQGQNASFNLSASGDAPLSYQWRFNGSPVGSGNGTTYTLNGVTSANTGDYDAVVSNAYGSVTSTVAQLTVLVPPSITSQPTDQTVLAASSAGFQVGASGTSPLTYQWWFNGTNGVGLNTNVLTLTNLQIGQAGDYSVVVTNSAGSVTSRVATLTVATLPSITQQPTNLVVTQGQTAVFNVAVAGTPPLGYQWRFNRTPLSASTAASCTVTGAASANAGNYDVVVTNTYGSITSAVAQLTVLVPPSITTQPSDQTVAVGGTVSFQVSVSGTSPLSYQWWFNGTNALGANTNVLTLTNAQASQAGVYNVVTTNSAGWVTSASAQLTVLVPPSIVGQPTNQTAVPGANVSFYVSATGSSPLIYRWIFNGATLSGATASTLALTSVQPSQAGAYAVIVTNAAGSATSATASLKVLVSPSLATPIPTGTAVSVPVSTVVGLSYLLEYKNALLDPVWTPAAPWQQGTGAAVVLQDTNAATAARFFRVRCQ